MSFDRKPWLTEFTKHGHLPWTCPACREAPLRLDAGTLHEGQTKESQEAQESLAAEWEWIDGRFACLFRCTRCVGVIAVAGSWRVEHDRYYDPIKGEQEEFTEYYRPRFFSESPHIVRMPENVPDVLAAELRRSFLLYWADPEACGNSIRRSIELLLTDQGVRRWVTVRKGERKGTRERLSLHRRIVEFQRTQEELGNAAMAVKWLGNAASHPDQFSTDSILDGYELLDFMLDELYVQRAKRASNLARAVTRRFAPRESRKRGV